MIVIVGHGPSILSGLGSVIDNHTVVRLKFGRRGDSTHWGTRTDYLCGRSVRHSEQLPDVKFWHFAGAWTQKWLERFGWFGPRIIGKGVAKPSHGLCAAFACMEYLGPKELAFIGCDRLMRPDVETWKWSAVRPECQPHDWRAEHWCLQSLGVRIIDLVEHEAKEEAI